MTTTPITVQAIEITGSPALDPIRVITQDLGPGQGRIIIECYGQAWSTYWPGMGNLNIRQFFTECDTDYLEMNLHRGANVTKRKRDYLIRIIKAVQTALAEK